MTPTSTTHVVVGRQLWVRVQSRVTIEACPARRGHGSQHSALQLPARIHLPHLLHGGVQMGAGGVLVTVLQGK